MKKAIMVVLTVALLGSLAPLSGAEWWEKKRYTEWSEKDVRKMLNDSPWAQDFEAREVSVEPLPGRAPSSGPPVTQGTPTAPPTDDPDAGLGAGQAVARTAYHFQIHSALPVRQAMVRRAQLQRDYAQMSAEEKQTFDEEVDQFLERDFSDRVVVFVWWESNVELDLEEQARHWQAQTTETLKDSVTLSGSKGRKAELQEFALAQESGRAFQFIFPRIVDGAELAGPEDKSLQLEFIHPGTRGRGDRHIVVEFKTKKMVVDGQLEY